MRVNRRKGPDFLVKVLTTTSVIGWLLILLALIFVFYSQPEMDTGIVRFHGIEIRDYWLTGWLTMATIFMFVSSIFSVIAWFFHRKRSKRRDDLPGALVFTLALLSFIGVAVLLRLLGQ